MSDLMVELSSAVNESVMKITELNWELGDQLLELQKHERNGFSPVRRFCKNGQINMTEGEARLRMRTASVYGSKEREYGLPWAMYAYCAARSKDPVGWITRASEERWSYEKLRSELCAATALDTALEDRIGKPERIVSVRVRNNATVSAYVNLLDPNYEPRIRIIQRGEYYVGEECEALLKAVARCVEEIKLFLGTENIVVEEEECQVSVEG